MKVKKYSKRWFIRMAVLRTVLFAAALFVAPLTSHLYRMIVGEKLYNSTYGYPVAASFVLILMSLVLTIRYYVLAFDDYEREKFINSIKEEEL